jgi:hypothetical protein
LVFGAHDPCDAKVADDVELWDTWSLLAMSAVARCGASLTDPVA